MKKMVLGKLPPGEFPPEKSLPIKLTPRKSPPSPRNFSPGMFPPISFIFFLQLTSLRFENVKTSALLKHRITKQSFKKYQ